MPNIRTQKQISAVALTRLRELLDDIQWKEEWAIDTFTDEIVRTLKRRPSKRASDRKAVEQWFVRKSIPPAHIFNISEVFGVSVEWLSGNPDKAKAEAITPGGLYERELERLRRREQA